MELIIKKGGILFDKEEKKVITNTVTCLFDLCILDKDIVLSDIFSLLRKEMYMYKIIIGNWVDEIVNEGLHATPAKSKCQDIEYLELYWMLEKQTYKGIDTLETLNFPGFHGAGYADKKGERQSWAIEMSPIAEIINKPLILRDKLEIYHSDLDNMGNMPKSQVFEDARYTLGQILYGIIWELSFCGSPKDRDELADNLKTTVDDIKSGNAKGKKYKTAADLFNDIEDQS